jgi:hypothetical protein
MVYFKLPFQDVYGLANGHAGLQNTKYGCQPLWHSVRSY